MKKFKIMIAIVAVLIILIGMTECAVKLACMEGESSVVVGGNSYRCR